MHNRRSIFYKLFASFALVSLLFVQSALSNRSSATSNFHPIDTLPFPLYSDQKESLATINHKTTDIATSYTSYTAPTVQPSATPAQNQSSATNYINLSGYNIPIFISYNTMTDSGSSAALYKTGKFIYAHNTIFGSLAYLGVGNTITISINGDTATYQIAYKETITKSDTQKIMGGIANAMRNGIQYSFSLMTCAGTIYGNGDASHRTIVYLIRV